MDVYIIKSDEVIEQIIKNLMDSGLMLPGEKDKYMRYLHSVEKELLLDILLESINLKDMYQDTELHPPTLIGFISKN